MQDLFSQLANGVRLPKLFNQASGPPVPFSSSRVSMFSNDAGLPVGERAYEAYGSVGTLFAIVSQLANKTASAEWHLYRKTSVRDKKRRQEIPNHPFLTVWDMPNPFYTGDMLREAVQQHLDLVGEGVIVLNTDGGTIYEMWPVRPDRIEPVKDPKRYIVGYIYKGPDGEEVPLALEQVIHIKLPNPCDPHRGMGPVQTVLNDIDAARYSAEWNRNFFINGARPGGIIEIDYRMEDKEFNEFLARWRQQHQGVANAHRVAVLENAKWVDTAFSMSDMQFVELRDLSRETIREAFAFPKPMLGTVDDVNRANADAGKEILAENHIEPRLRRWKTVVNTWLLPRFANGKTLELDFDDPTPVNHEAADRERNSQSSSARNLVLSGYHPDDVSDAMGLPRMRWVGIPAPAYETPSEEGDSQEKDPMAPTPQRAKVRV